MTFIIASVVRGNSFYSKLHETLSVFTIQNRVAFGSIFGNMALVILIA